MSAANPLFASLADGLSTTLDPLQFAARLGFPKLDDWQKQLLLHRDDKRVILACGRQVGKTEIVSIMALFEAITRPGSLVIILAASLRQSGLLFSRVKNHYGKLQNTMGATQSTALTLSLQNGSRIVALPAREETIRGWANVSTLLIDEAAHVDTDLYRATRAFLAVSNGRLILLSTPHSKRGFFFDAWTNPDEDWTRIRVTTEEISRTSGRVSDEFLQQERKALGDAWYRQEYLAEFVDSAYALIPYAVIQHAIDPSLKMLDIDLDSDDDDEFRLQYDSKQLDIDLDSD